MTENTEFTILVDGQCPFCRREINLLKRIDRRGALAFVDISDPNFDASRFGLSQDQVHSELHGMLADGQVTRGMETFRRAYAAIGLGWLLAPTGWPVLRPVFDLLYRIFARYRVSLGRLLGRDSTSTSCRIDSS